VADLQISYYVVKCGDFKQLSY